MMMRQQQRRILLPRSSPRAAATATATATMPPRTTTLLFADNNNKKNGGGDGVVAVVRARTTTRTTPAARRLPPFYSGTVACGSRGGGGGCAGGYYGGCGGRSRSRLLLRFDRAAATFFSTSSSGTAPASAVSTAAAAENGGGGGGGGDVASRLRQRRRRRAVVPREEDDDGLTLGDFIVAAAAAGQQQQQRRRIGVETGTSTQATAQPERNRQPLSNARSQPQQSQRSSSFPLPLPHNKKMMKFHLKTYGCQMNASDSDIVRRILTDAGYVERGTNDEGDDERDDEDDDVDVWLTNTCSIRQKAEDKVWHRLRELRSVNAKKRRRNKGDNKRKAAIVGVLGCMAERLKDDLLQDGLADLVVGPDAYRDLPRMLSSLLLPLPEDRRPQQERNAAVNVQLSPDETYADIAPVRGRTRRASSTDGDDGQDDVSAFVSIQRGCSNRCAFCVVPFTRGGRERSRPLQTIVDEVARLYERHGVKEVTLLGQNVNSYHDVTTSSSSTASDAAGVPGSVIVSRTVVGGVGDGDDSSNNGILLSNDGFRSRIRRRSSPDGSYYSFADLLDSVSRISPELRVRFTSPHPKDYPPPLLQLMSERPNICNHLHMPAQSGSTSVLRRMKRGYSREAYLQLIDDVKSTIPDVALSSDFIAGFCGETEDDHLQTLSLLERVEYDQAYLFAYSVREGTLAHRTLDDDVPHDVKQRRLRELIDTYQYRVHAKNARREVGRLRLVLVEGHAKRKSKGGADGDNNQQLWTGRTDQNKRILFSGGDDCPIGETLEPEIGRILSNADISSPLPPPSDHRHTRAALRPGDYAVCLVTEAKGHTLRGRVLYRATSQEAFASQSGLAGCDETSLKRASLIRSWLMPSWSSSPMLSGIATVEVERTELDLASL